MKKISLFATVALAFILVGCAGLDQENNRINWKKAPMVCPGVRLVKMEWQVPRAKPLTAEQVEKVHKEMIEKKRSQETIDNYRADVRPMKINVMRIDLTMKGLTFTGT